MALTIKFRTPTRTHNWASIALRVSLILIAAVAAAVLTVGGYYYVKYQHIVDQRLKQPLFKNTAKIFAEPREVRPGQKLSIRLIAEELRQANYTLAGTQKDSPMGTYRESDNGITIFPGPQSYHAQDSATIQVKNGKVDSIADDRGQPLASYELEP